MTLVSIVIPAHNAAKTLRLCLESALAQTHRPVEVIVVDDASTDDTRAIAAAYPCTVLAQPYNQGVSAARNAGAAASTGEVLFFLDSDVGLAPDAVAAAVRLLAADPGLGCVYGVYAKEPLIDDGRVEVYRTLHLHHALSQGAGLTSTAVFALAAMPRQVFQEVGPFDAKLRSAEDDEYSERLLAAHRIRLSAEVSGRHDEADRLLPLLAEQYRRAQFLRFSARNRMRPGALKVNRLGGVLAAAFTLATLPAALLWPPALALGAAGLAAFAAADSALTRFMLRERGPGFLPYFIGVHFLAHTALLSGAAVGWLRATFDSSFGPTRRPESVVNR
ncbi:glycosyltransferase family 2 protein [Acrocarpospora catenulata]|uniref:glycosyltransferase family 2 protein n=1 Tax=Acrocarpospora catenulata TaxID=2836182 RepID=UPI0020239F51|nr:glycosyltransferase family A protein [Acrocarpospora catenulata]